MQEFNQLLYDEISKLPLEKIGKALSYVRYLKQEPEVVLVLTPDEEKELDDLYASGDFVSSEEVLAMIEAMPDD